MYDCVYLMPISGGDAVVQIRDGRQTGWMYYRLTEWLKLFSLYMSVSAKTDTTLLFTHRSQRCVSYMHTPTMGQLHAYPNDGSIIWAPSPMMGQLYIGASRVNLHLLLTAHTYTIKVYTYVWFTRVDNLSRVFIKLIKISLSWFISYLTAISRIIVPFFNLSATHCSYP